MPDYFSQNQALWQEKYPNWNDWSIPDNLDAVEVLPARSGKLTLQASFGNRVLTFHSTYDPEKEAQKLVDNSLKKDHDYILVGGFGLGYHVRELLKRVPPHAHIIVLEPNVSCFRKAMECMDLAPVLRSEQVDFVLGANLADAALTISKTYNLIAFSDIGFIELSGSRQINDNYYQEVHSYLRNTVSQAMMNLTTVLSFKETWLKNTLLNLRDVVHQPGIASLIGKLENRPFIIVASGPSLNKNIHLLREAKGKAVIIAAGSAIRPLLKAGIEPDLMITIDGGEVNYEHYKGLQLDHIPLVYEPMAYHKIIEDHKGLKFVFSGGRAFMNWLETIIGPKGRMSTGGSVATLAFAFAVGLGANPIILMGQDLCMYGDQYYASGAAFEDRKLNTSNEVYYFKVPANDGGEVLTSRSLFSFLLWFENGIKLLPPHFKVINATEGGARIKGTTVMPMRDVIDQYCREAIPLQEIFAKAKEDYQVPDINLLEEELKSVFRRFGSIRRNAGTGEKEARKLLQLFEKSPNPGAQVNKILKEMTSVDKKIKKEEEATIFVQEILEEVCLRVMKGPLSKAPENESHQAKGIRSAKQSSSLYKGIADSCQLFCDLINQALPLNPDSQEPIRERAVL